MKKAFTLQVADGFARLVFDLPGEKVNKFSTPVMKELEELLVELERRSDIKVMSIESAKANIFIAGADITELQVITGFDEALGKARGGQTVFGMLEKLPFPTVAVINGACLGGGLELALACTYRIATDSDKTLLGCPEVQLGILPGWGGTQRLLKLVGLVTGLPMILTGKPANGKKALKIKLVDELVSAEFVREKADEFMHRCLEPGERGRIAAQRKRAGIQPMLLEGNPLGRAFVFRQARKDVWKSTGGHYPAAFKILDVVSTTYGKPLAWGLAREAEAFAQLATTKESKNLIQLFFTNEALKKDTGVDDEVNIRELKTAGVLGAGVMGGGISWLFSSKGIPVRMKDVNWEALGKGFAEAAEYFNQMLKKKKLTPDELNLRMHGISGTLDYSGFGDKQVVVEAIVEKMDVKKKVIAELEGAVAEDTVICSNTSALSITEMASELKHPERFVGMHFFNPVNRMPLVEVIPGEKTSKETIAAAVALAKKLGKTPVVVQNCIGFLVNRLLLPYMNEAVLIAEEGVGIERIDKLITKFGMPMGPFTLADEVGLDICWKVTVTLAEAYPSRMHTTDLLDRMYQTQHLLGKKGGKGFYIHGPGKHIEPNPAVNHTVAGIMKQDHLNASNKPDDEILERCMFIMINEASRCLEEGIVSSPEYLDMALIMGTGFPPFRGGLMRYADECGIANVVNTLKDMAVKHGRRFEPSPLLLRMADNGQRFYEREVRDE